MYLCILRTSPIPSLGRNSRKHVLPVICRKLIHLAGGFGMKGSIRVDELLWFWLCIGMGIGIGIANWWYLSNYLFSRDGHPFAIPTPPTLCRTLPYEQEKPSSIPVVCQHLGRKGTVHTFYLLARRGWNARSVDNHEGL